MTPRLGGNELAVSFSGEFLEAPPGHLETIFPFTAVTAAAECLIYTEIEDDCHIGVTTTHGEFVYRVDGCRIESAPSSLIGNRRCRISIAYYVLSRQQGRFDQLLNMLAPAGSIQQKLRHRIDATVIRIENEVPYFLSQERASRFPRMEDVASPLPELVYESAALRRCARPVDSFKNDEEALVQHEQFSIRRVEAWQRMETLLFVAEAVQQRQDP